MISLPIFLLHIFLGEEKEIYNDIFYIKFIWIRV